MTKAQRTGTNLRGIDLNLLVVLDALLDLRSVRRAGERLGLSQSATSHALDRLRKLTGDELLVRTVSGMEPTSRALGMTMPLRLVLQGVETVLAPTEFDPLTAVGRLAIAVETYETIVILPQLVDEMRKEAPGIGFTVTSGTVDEILAGIELGQIDVAIGLFESLPDRFMTSRLLSDTHACVMRADHPLAAGKLTLDTYLEGAHLVISMSGRANDVVDDVLAAKGLRRRVSMQLPNGLAAILALARSDLVASVTMGAARMFASTMPLAVLELPFAVPESNFRLIWNRRFHDSPPNVWLRRKLMAIGASAARASPHAVADPSD